MSSRCDRLFFHVGIVGGFGLGGRDVADERESRRLLNQSHPFEGGVLDGFHRTPRAAAVDDLGLVETVDRFGQGIVVAVADAATERVKAGLGEALGVFG